MNVSLTALERLLHRYTMEPTSKPFDVRSVPVEAIQVEQPKGSILIRSPREQRESLFVRFVSLATISISTGVSPGGTDAKKAREDTFSGQCLPLNTCSSFLCLIRTTLGDTRIRSFGTDIQIILAC